MPAEKKGRRDPADLCSGDDRPLLPPDAFDPEPVKRGAVHRSRMGRRRAIVLVLIHLAIFAHILHWLLKGRTLTPVEPSEAMYTIANGAVNAGTILLILSLLATVVLGRWFCGWACHLVALQDLCAWLLKKAHIRPRPIRSRLLIWIPLLAGIHLFFWPLFVRAYSDSPAPPLSDGLMRDDFWETFPGPVVATLTLVVCGFVIVYLLGSKGFCTYACPYGGFFGVVDRFAPGRIRVTDACKGCGHCSAICTSNVKVAKEVHEYGMVVDPGCMKCLDCVSVCPEDALYYGFGKPAARAAPRVKHPKKVPPQFGIGEEITMVVSFSVTMVILRGVPKVFWPDVSGILYGEMPQLFALGVAAIVAFMSVFLWRMMRRADVTFQKWTLKHAGSLSTAGRTWLVFAILLFAFVLHSAVVQVVMWKATSYWSATRPIANDVVRQVDMLDRLGGKIGAAVDAGDDLLALADSIGLFPDWRIHHDRAWFALCRRDLDAAAAHAEQAIDIAPGLPNLRYSLSRIRVLQGRHEEAWTLFEEARVRNSEHGGFGDPARRLTGDLVGLGMAAAAYDLLAAAPPEVRDEPDRVLLRADLALVLGKNDAAFVELEKALALPDAPARIPDLLGRVMRFVNVDAARAIVVLDRQRKAQPDAYYLHVLSVLAAMRSNQLHEAERLAQIMVGQWKASAPPGFPAGHPQIVLADVLEQRDEKVKAAALRARAREINPAVWK